MNRSIRSLLAATAAVLVVGCGQPELIDRTQPNYTKKSDLLDAQWYMHETIVDAPKTSGAAAIVGYSGKMEKVRFEIQEDILVAYRSYEIVPGADPRVDTEKSTLGHVVLQNGKPFKGNPVAAYRITSHFDRQRQYNPSTGEQTNVLVEDTQDRPWYAREYMRVNWQMNLLWNHESVTGPTSGLFLHYTTAQDQAQADEAQVFEYSGGKLRYFDFTTQVIANPASVYYAGYGDVPLCLFDENLGAGNPTVDCESQNVKVRTSILRVNDDRVFDYEPLAYGDKLMKKFGFFRNEANSYNKDYYYTESGRQLYAMRHNIWQRSKWEKTDVKKFAQQLAADGLVADEELQMAVDSEPSSGQVLGEKLIKQGALSRDQFTAEIYKTIAAGGVVVNAKTGMVELEPIPVIYRELRPIVYHMTVNTPAEILPAASMRHAEKAGMDPKQTIEASWDHSFRRAVAVPRGLEPSQIDQMFYMCESPVPEGAPSACGKPGTYARIGDIRFNMVPWVEQTSGGLLGLGPSAMDPETGEVIHAAANIYGPGVDSWSAGSMQIMDVLNGDITIEELIAGKDIKGYVFEHLNATDPRRPLNGPWTSQQPLTANANQPLSASNKPTGRLQDLISVWRSQRSLPLAKQNRKEVVAQILKENPSLDQELINLPEVRTAVNSMVASTAFKAKLNSDPKFFNDVARNVLLGIDPIQKARDKVRNEPSPQLGCILEYSYDDEDYIGVATRKKALMNDLITNFTTKGHTTCQNTTACSAVEAKALARKEVWDSLRREAYRSITEHEIGHTLGLMHNFVGSADAMNFKEGYWDLRKETIGVTVANRRVMPLTPQNMVDAAKPNQHQLNEGMYEYNYSSIMDYGARVNAQNRGVGKYDDAAILFAYSGGADLGWVEVFNDMRRNYDAPNITIPVDNQAKVFTVRGAHVEIPLAQVEHYTPVSTFYSDKYHYTTLPFHFADQDPSLEKMLDQGIKRMNDRSYRQWSEMSTYYSKIEASLKKWTLDAAGFLDNDFSRARDIINAAGGPTIPVEVPYMFCSDYEVGANMMCNRHDQGADVFEMSSKWLERFNQTYVFSNFRRDRLIYSPALVASGKFGRYLGNMPNIYQQWLFNIYYLSNYDQLSPEELDKFYGLGDPIWQNYWTMAVVDSTNLLMQQLAIPSVGYHGKRQDGSWEYLPTGDAQNRRYTPAAEADFVNKMKLTANGGYLDVAYVPRGPGRSMFTVTDTFGYDNFNRVNEAGHFWDVYAAMLALTTSETNFLGVDRGSDALRYSLPYYTTFNKELSTLFGAYWAETPDLYAPMIGKNSDGTATVSMPTFIRGENYVAGFVYPPPAVTPIDTTPPQMSKVLVNPTWSARFYAQVWGMAFFTTNYNLEYAEFSKVYRLGSSEALTPAAGYEVIDFEDPFGGGYVYAALHRLGDPSYPPARSMMQRARQQAEKWRQVCRLDKGLQPGDPVNLPCDVVGNNKVDGKNSAQWEADVRETVRSLEMMRGLYNIFGRAL